MYGKIQSVNRRFLMQLYMPKTLAFSSSRSFVHNFYETRLSLKILDDEVPYKLSYFDLSHFAYYCTRKEGSRNREKAYCSVVFSYPILAHISARCSLFFFCDSRPTRSSFYRYRNNIQQDNKLCHFVTHG